MCLSCWVPITKSDHMDAKIKKAGKAIEKVEKKQIKGLLKEDKKLDAKRDRLETAVHKMKKKGC